MCCADKEMFIDAQPNQSCQWKTGIHQFKNGLNPARQPTPVGSQQNEVKGASQFFTPVPRLSLTPRFSGVNQCAGPPNRFSGFWVGLEPVSHSAENGVNESTAINHLGLDQVLKNWDAPRNQRRGRSSFPSLASVRLIPPLFVTNQGRVKNLTLLVLPSQTNRAIQPASHIFHPFLLSSVILAHLMLSSFPWSNTKTTSTCFKQRSKT